VHGQTESGSWLRSFWKLGPLNRVEHGRAEGGMQRAEQLAVGRLDVGRLLVEQA